MASRLNLQEELEEFIGNRNVYFQPPESLKIKYPCIIYNLDGMETAHADNTVFRNTRRYSVSYLTDDPDDELIDEFINSFSNARFDRQYTADNIYHNVFTLYY